MLGTLVVGMSSLWRLNALSWFWEALGKGGDLRKGQTVFTVPLSQLQVLDSQNGMVYKLPSSQWARETQADHRTA